MQGEERPFNHQNLTGKFLSCNPTQVHTMQNVLQDVT